MNQLDDKNDAFKWRFFWIAYDELGIYPKSIIGGDKPYEKRTEYMEGWNDCMKQLLNNYQNILSFFLKIKNEDIEKLGDLMREGIIHLDDKNLYVSCNDIFAWGCSDEEILPNDQINTLYNMWLEDKTWGSIKWCCLQRNMKPQKSVENDMKLNGAWDGKMQNLPEN